MNLITTFFLQLPFSFPTSRLSSRPFQWFRASFFTFFYLFCNSNYFLLRREWTIVEKAKKYFPRYSVRHEICRSVFLDGASSRPSQMGKCTAELKVGLLMPMPDNNSRKWAVPQEGVWGYLHHAIHGGTTQWIFNRCAHCCFANWSLISTSSSFSGSCSSNCPYGDQGSRSSNHGSGAIISFYFSP